MFHCPARCVAIVSTNRLLTRRGCCFPISFNSQFIWGMVSACSSYCLFQHWELLPLISFNINHLNCFVSKESSININDLVCLVNVFSFPTRTILTPNVKEQRAFRIIYSNFNFNYKLFPSLKTCKWYCKLLCFKGLSFYVIGFGRNVIGGISPSLGSLLYILSTVGTSKVRRFLITFRVSSRVITYFKEAACC